MKYLMLTVAFIFTLSLTAQGAAKLGSKCGLVDSWGEVDDAGITFDFSKPIDKMKGLLKSLVKSVRSQIVSSANNGRAKEREIEGVPASIKALQEASEGGEVYLKHATIKGKKFSVLSFYGGGNHTGYIYEWGKWDAVASISDDDIVCAEKAE